MLPIINVRSVMCVMRVRHDIHVMSPIPFFSYNLQKSRLQLYVSRDMRSNHFPSIIVLSVMRDMRVIHVIHVVSHPLLL